jgi:predicted acylesterase/phospholipase RssA
MWQHRTTNPGAAAAVFLEMILSRHYGLVHELLDQIPAPALLHGAPLRRMLIDALGGEQVPTQPGVRLAVNAVDLGHCRPARFINLGTVETEGHVEYIVGDTIHVDMVLGSAAIPVLLPLVAVGSHRLWDGGLLVNAPLASAVSLEADEIVPVLSNARPDGTRELATLGDTLQRLLDIITEHCFDLDRKLLLERNKLARHPEAADGKRYREVKLYEAIRPERNDVFNTGSYLDFSGPQLERMYEQGRARARSWLAAGPKPDELPPKQPTSSTPPTPVRG